MVYPDGVYFIFLSCGKPIHMLGNFLFGKLLTGGGGHMDDFTLRQSGGKKISNFFPADANSRLIRIRQTRWTRHVPSSA